jgi:hypothetical protein
VTSFSDGTMYLFVRGTDNRIYQNHYDRGWGGWSEVPGGGSTPSAPAAANYQGGAVVFVRGTDNRIYQNHNNDRGWSEVPGGGTTLSGPAATATDAGTALPQTALYVFVRGTDNHIYWNSTVTAKSFDCSTWSQAPFRGSDGLIHSRGGLACNFYHKPLQIKTYNELYLKNNQATFKFAQCDSYWCQPEDTNQAGGSGHWCTVIEAYTFTGNDGYQEQTCADL